MLPGSGLLLTTEEAQRIIELLENVPYKYAKPIEMVLLTAQQRQHNIMAARNMSPNIPPSIPENLPADVPRDKVLPVPGIKP